MQQDYRTRGRHAAIIAMRHEFRRLESAVAPPSLVLLDGEHVLRYVEQTVEQALIQKLARYVSGLGAMEILLATGYVQEQAVIQRTLDDIGEDITFLSLGLQLGLKKVHKEVLKNFWQEEFEEGIRPIDNTRPRYTKRKDIRKYIEGLAGVTPDSDAAKCGPVMQQAYSGYVHAQSPHIMEMCGGHEPRFFIAGLKNTSRIPSHAADLWNYVYRGFCASLAVAKALGAADSVTRLYAAANQLELQAGTDYMEVGQAAAKSITAAWAAEPYSEPRD